MNRPVIILAALAALAVSTVAHAVPVNAVAVADASLTFRINDGTAAVGGVEISDSVLAISPQAVSALDAPDATNTSGGTTVIAGSDPSDPSEFTGFDRTTRNAGTEGAEGDFAFFTYGVRVLGPGPGLANPVVDSGISGTGLSTAQITTQPFDTSANATATVERLFEFENFTVNAVFFTITAEIELSAAALFNGAEGFARSSVDVELIFDSADPLAISFAPLFPYLPDEQTVGDNAATTLTRFTDPSGIGRVGLVASASALGVDAIGMEAATVLASDTVVLGVTLQAGQQMTMLRRFSYTTAVEIRPQGAVVAAPAVVVLMVAGFCGLRIARPRG